MLKVEDLFTSVRTGGKKEKVCNVFTSHPVSERGGGKEEEGVLSHLVSDMRQPKVDSTNASKLSFSGNVQYFISIKMYFTLSKYIRRQKTENKKMSCSYLKLGIKLWENSPKTNCWYEKTFYLRQFEFALLLVDLLSRNVICGRSNHVTAH